MKLERRSTAAAMAPAVEGKTVKLKIPYNSMSTDMGFREIISPGAFKRTLDDPEADVLALWSHDSTKPMGRRSAGTLDLEDCPDGLLCEIEDDETSWSEDARAAVQARSVQGASFGFIVAPDGDEWDRSGGTWIRTLRDVDLLEVSPTALPAYGESDATVS